MAAIREKLVWAAYNRAFALTDPIIHNGKDGHEFRKQTVLADESLTKDEKSEAIKWLNAVLDIANVRINEGIKRICENCQDECLAISYCEHCVRNYLKAKFSNWTSGNNDIDNLIQKCQMEAVAPDKIVEWIPYNNLQNIKYLTKGGCSEIYTADWIDGSYDEWDSKEKRLKRSFEFGIQYVILKKLKNVESANRSWFEESKSHLTISSKHGPIVSCFGLTKDPSDGNYMLVMTQMDLSLRNYLQQYHNKLTWKERIQIIIDIIDALNSIHLENAIHRDLHSGNILYNQTSQIFRIGDLGFCGPADKPLNSVYGNLPYIAPEVITGKETTFASDIYSIGMLMWEISSGQPPFVNKHNYDLAIKIVNGMRPKIIPGTPLEYKELMEQCWDADPTKRPDVETLYDELVEMRKLSYQNEEQQINSNSIINNSQFNTSFSISSSSINSFFDSSSSRIYKFKNLPEPKNATKEEQEAYHSDLSISDNENNDVKDKYKRTYSSNFDDNKEDLIDKRIKLNNKN